MISFHFRETSTVGKSTEKVDPWLHGAGGWSERRMRLTASTRFLFWSNRTTLELDYGDGGKLRK